MGHHPAFVIEAVLISFAGGLVGVGRGICDFRIDSCLRSGRRCNGFSSILLAFLVHQVGLIFWHLPAMKRRRLDPVEAIPLRIYLERI